MKLRQACRSGLWVGGIAQPELRKTHKTAAFLNRQRQRGSCAHSIRGFEKPWLLVSSWRVWQKRIGVGASVAVLEARYSCGTSEPNSKHNPPEQKQLQEGSLKLK